MDPIFVLIAIGAIVFALINLFKVKASLVFLALAAGSLLTQFVGDGVLDFMQFFFKEYSVTNQAIIQIGLLALPVFLTILLMRKTAIGSKFITNIFPAALTGLMAVYLTVPLLTAGTANNVTGSEAWSMLSQYQTVLVGTAVFISMIQLWASGKGMKVNKRGRKGK